MRAEVRGDGGAVAAQGANVKLVSVTNGDIGHFAQAGGPLAQRRKAEVEACHRSSASTPRSSTSTTAS